MVNLRRQHQRQRMQCRVIILLWLWPLAASFALLSPQLGTENPQAGVPFSVMIESHDPNATPPDLTPLEGRFEILGTSKSQHVMIQNGRRSQSTQWVITLVTTQSGSLELPALSLGQESTAALMIEVQPAAPDSGSIGTGAWLEVELTPDSVYVQQQCRLSVRVLRPRGTELDGATLSAPEFTGGDVVLESLDKDRSYRIERDGQSLEVIERSYFLFPQSSGELTLKPLVLLGRWVEGAATLFDPFGATIRPLRLETEAKRLRVKPAPGDATRAPWLPAEELLLTETWSPDGDSLPVGVPMTRTIGLLARGLTAAQLPDLTASLPPGLRAYPEQAVLNNQKGTDGVVGSRTLKLVMVASKPGDYRIPEIELRWFNLFSGSFESVKLAARSLHITAPDAGLDAPSAVSPTGTSSDAATGLNSAAAGTAAVVPPRGYTGWAASFLAGLVLGLLVAWAWLRGSSPVRAESTARAEAPGASTAEAALKQAMAAARAQQADDCRRALLAAGPYWLGPTAPRGSLTQLAHALPDGALAREIKRLSAALYAPAGPPASAWDGGQLAEAIKSQPAYRPRPAPPPASAVQALLDGF